MAKSTLATVFGVIFLILSLIGLAAGIFEYPIWNRNNEVLQRNEAIGHFSQEDSDLVRFQFSIMAVGFGSFVIFLVLALYLLWESPIDRLTNKLNHISSTMQSPPSSPFPPVNNTPVEEKEDFIIKDGKLFIDPSSLHPRCPRCMKPIEESWKRCPVCLLPLKLNCPNCDKNIDIKWRACPHCGKILKKKQVVIKKSL